MEIVWWILTVLLFVLSFVGLILPVLPGTHILSFAGFLVYQFLINSDTLPISFWVGAVLITLVVVVVDYVAGVIGAQATAAPNGPYRQRFSCLGWCGLRPHRHLGWSLGGGLLAGVDSEKGLGTSTTGRLWYIGGFSRRLVYQRTVDGGIVDLVFDFGDVDGIRSHPFQGAFLWKYRMGSEL